MYGTKPKRTLFTPFPRNQPSIPVDKAEPPLYGRAWVLQEQMLSTRMLCYEVDQMRWECLSTHGSERSPLGGAARRPGYFKDIQNGIASTKADFLLPETLNILYNHQSWCLTVMVRYQPPSNNQWSLHQTGFFSPWHDYHFRPTGCNRRDSEGHSTSNKRYIRSRTLEGISLAWLALEHPIQ
jgi:hypothetical protein